MFICCCGLVCFSIAWCLFFCVWLLQISVRLTIYKIDFICLNYANADMVGHTGVFSAAMEAAVTVDNCLERLIPVLLANAYEVIVIADHGNADYMINEDGTANTAHTKNPVPCVWVSDRARNGHLKDGKLADLAPTLLTLMEIPLPPEMDGDILIS